MAPTKDRFARLPDEVLACVIERVGAAHKLGSCFLVCKRWARMARALSRLKIHLRWDSSPYDPSPAQWKLFTAIFSSRQLLSHLFIKLPFAGMTRRRDVEDILGSGCLSICIRLITCGLKTFELVGNVEDSEESYQSCSDVLGALCTSQTRKTLEVLELKGLEFSVPVSGVIPSTLPRLRYCRLFGIQMEDYDLSDLLELSPNLVELHLEYCTGLVSPAVSSHSLRLLKFFCLFAHADPRAALSNLLVVNAPELRRLELCSVKKVELQATARSIEMLALYSATAVAFKDEFSTRVEQLVLSRFNDRLWTEEGLTTTMAGFAAEEVHSVFILSPLSATSILRPSHSFQGSQELTLGTEAYQCCRRIRIASLKKITVVDIEKIRVGWFVKVEKGCQSLVDILLTVHGKRGITFTRDAIRLQQSLSRAKLSLTNLDTPLKGQLQGPLEFQQASARCQ